MMMSVYVIYFALNREHLIESLWFWTCVSWFAMDILIVSPLVVLYTEVFSLRRLSPNIEDIRKVMRKAFVTDNANCNNDSKESPAPFLKTSPIDEVKKSVIKE